jgi:formylglycine-generating enzyme required for sulfatase activity
VWGVNNEGLPNIKWQKIPESKVTIQDKYFSVEAFYLAAYPITIAQFQCFIDDPNGYKNPRWWEGLDVKPDTPVTPRWSEANHPRETESWFEAMAFCAWLSERLGFVIKLPTEWQWQQAVCSGETDFSYPWGKDYQSGYANINEAMGNVGTHNLQRTTAVDLYPHGNSHQGVADLSGNVWERCLNKYDTPENIQDSKTLGRVVRGGSWAADWDCALASNRSGYGPGNRFNSFGFRVYCVFPILNTGKCGH